MAGLSRYTISAACLLLSALPASAQSRDYWSGLYGGMDVGAAWDKMSWDWNVPGNAALGNGALDQYSSAWSDRNLVGGLHLGYQQKFGMVLAGVELAYLSHNASRTSAVADALDTRNLIAHVGNIYSIAMRLGVVQDRWLAYGKGGYALTDMSFASQRASDGATESATSHRSSGYVLGGGLEYALSQSVSFGTEYNYLKFSGKGSGSTDVSNQGTVLPFTHSGDVTVQTWTMRLNYRLN